MKLDSFIPASGPEPAFREFWSSSRNRSLAKPNGTMAELQRRLLRYLTDEIFADLPYAHGSVRGRSILTNASPHRYSRYFYVTDLSSAYPSVSVDRLAEVLMHFDRNLADDQTAVTTWLRRYCFTRADGLVQGGAASPTLFNLYAHYLIDDMLAPLLRSWHVRYTRYLDDLCFSSAEPIGDRKRRKIRQIIESAGFKVEHRKSRVVDLRKGSVVVAGVLITTDGRLVAPGRQRRRAAGVMHLAQNGEIDPSIAHGVAGAVYAASSGGVSANTLRKLRASQLALISDNQ